MKNASSPLTLVLGGARSGKSAFAEARVEAAGPRRLYIATAEAFDAEMTARIAAHRERRGAGWRTLEAPRDPGAALGRAEPGEAVLLDCLTLWLATLMHHRSDVDTATTDLLEAARGCAGPVVMVSNEVGMGIVPENALARRFRDAQGRLNARIAAEADKVAFVAAGLPLWLK